MSGLLLPHKGPNEFFVEFSCSAVARDMTAKVVKNGCCYKKAGPTRFQKNLKATQPSRAYTAKFDFVFLGRLPSDGDHFMAIFVSICLVLAQSHCFTILAILLKLDLQGGRPSSTRSDALDSPRVADEGVADEGKARVPRGAPNEPKEEFSLGAEFNSSAG